MKLTSIVLASAAGLSLLASCTGTNKETAKELTVLEWNIWHGGHSEHYGQKACDATIGIIRESGADVVLMVETYGASNAVADSLGFYHRLLSSNLSIYSRYPITKTYTYTDSIATFNFGGAELDVEGTKVRVFDTWLHYLPDERLTPTDSTEAQILAWDDAGTRDDEMRTILNILKPMIAQTDSIPIIIGGDFNSHSHLDWTEATKDMYHHGGAVVNWTVSRMMADAGFHDSFRTVNPDPATKIGTTWLTDADSLETPNRQDRIDYIYYRGATIKAVESECYDNPVAQPYDYKGKSFFYPSDHGFVVTKFEIKPSR